MPLPSISQLVKDFRLTANKNLSQNFIFDLNLTNKIAKEAGCLEEYNILEIGPGPGSLTRALINQGAKNLALIEYDPRFIPILEQLRDYHNKINFKIYHSDALHIDESKIFDNDKKIKIIANLPYNIATNLLLKWLNRIELFASMTLMFQKEVAQRITAKPKTKSYGRLSVMTQSLAQVSYLFDIQATNFVPAPKVTSALIKIIPSQNPLLQSQLRSTLEKVCRVAFNQRRKTLRSSLKGLNINIESLLTNSSIDLSWRAEELSIDQFCQLSELVFHYKHN